MSIKKTLLEKVGKRKFWAGLFVALSLVGVAVPGPVQDIVTNVALSVVSTAQEKTADVKSTPEPKE